MQKKSIKKYQILSAVFVAILGTLLHFTFEWSGNNLIVGAISAVNESTWEHLKLLYFPMLITTIFGYFYFGKGNENSKRFLCAKTVGIIVSVMFTIIFFYTYTGVLGNNYAIIDISIFFVAVILGEYTAYKIVINNVICNTRTAIVILGILLISFVYFTYNTPRIGIFKDPVNGEYGIELK